MIDATDEFLVRAMNRLPSGATTVRSAWGSTTMRSTWRNVSPRRGPPRPARSATALMPERTVSAMKAPV